MCKKLEILGKADVIHTARGSGLLEIRSAQFHIPLFATSWMERGPLLKHTAHPIRMADDFSGQDNSGITVGNLLPDPEVATAATCGRQDRGSKGP